MSSSSNEMPKKDCEFKMPSTNIMPDDDNNDNKRKSVFEGMEFHEAELRTPNDKPPFRFASEASSLDESKRVEFTLRDDVVAFIAGKRDPLTP